VPNLADDVDTLETCSDCISDSDRARRRAWQSWRLRAAHEIVVLSAASRRAFVRGLVDVVDPAQVTVIGNVGDDLEVLGMHVSPDSTRSCTRWRI